MNSFEKLVKSIMRQAELDNEPVSREEAEEIAKMELKAKEIIRYEQGEGTPKERKPRTIKKDSEKIEIISKIYNLLLTQGYDNVTIVNEQREISFNDFSITLTKHRKKER